jgi:hypothetical protein
VVKHVTLVLQAEEVEHLAESQYLSIAASKSGHAIQLVLSPKISKCLVAYMAGLVAVSPYKHGLFDSSYQGCLSTYISRGAQVA